MRVKLRVVSCLPGPHGHDPSAMLRASVAVLQSSGLMNQAQEPRLWGGSFVAVALYATAELASNRFPAGCRLSLTRMGFIPAQQQPMEKPCLLYRMS